MPASLGEMIGFGASGKVYAYGRDKVMKVFRPERDLEHVEREFRNARSARDTGLPVPEAYELVRHGEQYGIIYQRVPGEQLVQFLFRYPWTMGKMARRFARLHLAVHQRSVAGLRWQISHYMERILQSNAIAFPVQRKVLELLCSLPVGEALCHGDFIPANIVVTADREMVIVDWPNASSGNPIACVADTVLGLGRERETRTPIFRRGAKLFRKAYLEECARLRPGFAEEFAKWQTVIAAARLNGSVSHAPERARLLAIILSGLQRSQVESERVRRPLNLLPRLRSGQAAERTREDSNFKPSDP